MRLFKSSGGLVVSEYALQLLLCVKRPLEKYMIAPLLCKWVLCVVGWALSQDSRVPLVISEGD